jgi:hypothetical protein
VEEAIFTSTISTADGENNVSNPPHHFLVSNSVLGSEVVSNDDSNARGEEASGQEVVNKVAFLING